MNGKMGKVLASLVACLLLASAGATGAMVTKSNSNSANGTANIMTKPGIVLEDPLLDGTLGANEHDSGVMAISENKQKLIYSLQVENGDEYTSAFDIRNNSTDKAVAAITVKSKPIIEDVKIGFTGAGVGRIAPNKWLVGPIEANSVRTVDVQIGVSRIAKPETRIFEIKVAPTEFKSLDIAE